MAPAAVGTELSVVDIVARVAIAAATAQISLRFQFLPMAGLATDGAVCSVEHEWSLGVVVKTPFCPVDRRVTRRAVIWESFFVRVVVCMAATAGLGCIPKDLRFVAGCAFGIRVLAEQREACQVVIEEHIFAPGDVVVTITAQGPLCAAMRVVVLVAFATARQWLGVEDGVDMTVSTLNRSVRTM